MHIYMNLLCVIAMLALLARNVVTAAAAAAAAAPICVSQSQPNPIAKQYPKEVTGTINGTYGIILIPFDTARSIVPRQYGILTSAYEHLFSSSSLPKGMYPAVLEALLDHDVQSSGVAIPDFKRIAIKMPFVDRINDGYTSFKYSPPQLISLNPVALGGSAFYGKTVPGTFEPPCDAYAGDGKGSTYTITYVAPGSGQLGSKPAFVTKFMSSNSTPYGLDIFRNLTNQPTFGDGVSVCDNYITLFNTTVTMGTFAPTPIKGTVNVIAPFFPKDATFADVWGYNMDNAFIERNNVPCQGLQGYSGTGPGD